ncbi:gamma-glutamyltranspeptidase / glutathione hydrolase [Natronorubrum sediminis]|uniref:Gamma-glutamyltranspeptidase / glutathione hydrolase n=1 Tax=Natronorubrum sediminis TaxID=640943 RepID=A0A1H6FVU4_9EURY|nr:gamma-glutamyltransferase [Natronorubrum sediminis]SEH14921.1 gamma-glutamyltranspeptidase / glutathione hydrolase [Natronorubrum sediminis]
MTNRRTFLERFGSETAVTGVIGANAPGGSGIGAAERNEYSPSSTGEFEYPWQFIGRRSAVMARNGMVATSHPLAAETGVRVLQNGGNAADAAVAVAAELAFVEPHMTTLGGDIVALTHFDGEYKALNGTGYAPAAADVETYREKIDETDGDASPSIPSEGPLSVTVPGVVDGLYRLSDRYGDLPFADVLQPAIQHARDGVPISEYIATQWEAAAPRVAAFESFRETYLENGETPAPESVFTNRAFAESLERIANEGIETVYGGQLGQQIVNRVQEHDGLLELEDLEAFESNWNDPISTEYQGYEVLEHPPNTIGVVALEALNIVEHLELPDEPTDPERLHKLIEAIKIAFTDAEEYLGDPLDADVPLESKLDEAYARERATEIGESVGEYDPEAGDTPNSNTVYLTVVDRNGNAVSMLTSGFKPFGSGLVVGGFTLQNHATEFSLDPADPNAIEPRKRPFHTLIPGMLAHNGEFRASFGVMGGSMMPQGHLQLLANTFESGLNPQAAIDVPRFRFEEGHEVALETTRLPEETIDSLRERGHEIVLESEYFEPDANHFGGAQFIYRDSDGTLIGGSDPRRDGQAIGF